MRRELSARISPRLSRGERGIRGALLHARAAGRQCSAGRGAQSGGGGEGAERPVIFRRSVIAASFAALLAGCMMGPDYVRPPVDAPQKFAYEPADARDTANTEWWKQFGDPVLDGLITEALANNKNVQIAAANVEQAAAVLTQTRSPLYPQLNYQANAARFRFSQSSTTDLPGGVSNPTNAYSVLAGASWEIDLWGRIRRLSEAAQANLLASDEARRGVILSLVASVAANYFQLRGLDEQLVISKRTLGTYGESVKLFELQFKYGQVSQMNVAQAKSQYETAAAQIPLIESQIVQTENALSILLGRNPGEIARGKTIYELSLPAVPAGLPSALLEQRPDLLQAEQSLVAANAQIGAAKALYFPTISLTGAFGTASTQLHELFSGPTRTWNYAGSLVGPIFTAGSISAQVAQAEAGQKAALLSYQAAIQSAFADVETALVANAKLGEQSAAQERLVLALKDYSRLARLQYDGGFAPYSTVLQAEQQLFPAELTWATTRSQLYSSSVTIYQAMGGGWVNEADKLAPQPVPGEGWFAPALPSGKAASQPVSKAEPDSQTAATK
jgi:outer membrane protein, multidrug efflux system